MKFYLCDCNYASLLFSGTTRMELLFDNVTLQIYLLHTIGHFQVIWALPESYLTLEDLGLWRIKQNQQWRLFLLQVCPAVHQARSPRPCDRPRWRCRVLHSQLRGEIWSLTPCVLPGNVQPGEWKDKICQELVQVLEGFFPPEVCNNLCFPMCFTELWRHWTMPNGSFASYWCTFMVTITKTRMSFAGIVTLRWTTSWKVLNWVSNLSRVTLLPCSTVEMHLKL